MSRTAAKFTQADINRALKAISASGNHGVLHLSHDGSIWIIPAHLCPAMAPENQNQPRGYHLPAFDAYNENRPVM